MIKVIITLLLSACLLQGCAGTRHSYTPLLEPSDTGPLLRLKQGQTIELLAIGDGFPGWWGYYPGVMTSSKDIASVDCRETRSFIPFREPGILFGGVVCDLIAHNTGTATLFFGNQYSLSSTSYKTKVDVIIE